MELLYCGSLIDSHAPSPNLSINSENVLLQFPHQIDKEEDLAFGAAALAAEDSHDTGRNSIGTSVEDLEAAVNDSTLSTEERKRIRKRLKKKRQKERKRAVDSNDDSEDDGDSASSTTEDDPAPAMAGNSGSYALSDKQLNVLIGKSSGNDVDLAVSHNREQRRIEHNRFLATNFGPQRAVGESGLTKIARERIVASKADSRELQSFFDEAGELGIARLCIVLRQYSTEEELADALSSSLGDVGFVNVGQDREWLIKLSVSALESEESTSHTYIKLSQRLPLEIAESLYFTELVNLIGENFDRSEPSNLPELPDTTINGVSGGTSSPTFSILSLECPTMSTMVGLGFLESRLPGVAFLTYRRDDGVPSLDNLAFGHHSDKLCDHPLAMRISGDVESPLSRQGSSIFGFDMRLAPVLNAHPVGVSGSSFALAADNQDLLQMWEARNSLEQRIHSFSGIDPFNQATKLVGQNGVRESRKISQGTDAGFQEGEKKAPVAEVLTAPSSLENSASSPSPPITHSPDLKDVKMLTSCRAVIVDLGNACWTYRHFSEDIQTRQYRAPEVLIGSKYDTSADIWSLGCMVFELLTGDLLFDPRAGEDYDRDEDHLAMFQELLGQMPKRLALDGKYSKNFFDKKGNLRHIKQLKFWPMEDVLSEKYHFPREEAMAIADFVRPLLDFDPKTRMTAEQALKSDWLQSIP